MPDETASDSSENYVERALKLLEQQSGMFGPFSLPDDLIRVNHQEPEENNTGEPLPNEQTESELLQGESTGYASDSKTYEEPGNQQDSEAGESVEDIASQIAACRTLDELRSLCERAEELKTDLESTRLVFGTGNPDADLMVIGEAPGENEDKQGEPFVGAAGQLLDKIIAAIDFRREDIYIANILKHRPPGNRNPLPEECERSLPFLEKQIELIDPLIILTVGKFASTTLLSKDTTLGALRQKIHSYGDREVVATYHPAALLRNQQWKRPTWEDVKLLRRRFDELKAEKG